MQAPAWAHSSTLTLHAALVPVANSADRDADPAKFRAAPPSAVLHEYILLPGWVKKAQFEALCQWLESQGFVIVRANGPVPWQTYPSVKFNGTVAQFNQAFHVTVMEKLQGFPQPACALKKGQVVRCMEARELIPLIGISELGKQIGAGGIEEPIECDRPVNPRRDE